MMNIAETLGLSIPIFQAPLSCFPNQEKLVAAVSKNGALGILCANYQNLSELEKKIKYIQLQTSNPFAIMLDISAGKDKIDLADQSQANQYLAMAYKQLQIEPIKPPRLPGDSELLQLIIDNNPPVIIFQNGLPDNEVINQCKSKDIIVMAIASNTLEAIAANKVVDAIILQGSEAAGVQSRFPNKLATPSFPIGVLLHHALANVDKPLIVWGNAQLTNNIASNLINGASAVILDSIFWTAQESVIPSSYRNALITQHNEMQTTLTSIWLGTPAQTLKNTLTNETQRISSAFKLSPKMQQRIMLPVIKAAIAQNNPNYMPMWAGLCVTVSEESVSSLCKCFSSELNEIIA